MTTTEHPVEDIHWYALSPEEAARAADVDLDRGLDAAEAQRRLAEYGPNQLPTEPPPGLWTVARGQLSNPMNIMLLLVTAASFGIQQWATAVVVLGLVTFNVVMGSIQVYIRRPGRLLGRQRVPVDVLDRVFGCRHLNSPGTVSRRAAHARHALAD